MRPAPPKLLTALVAFAFVTASHAAPLEYLPVNDPLEAELRVLDLYEPSPAAGRLALPHLHGRPVRLADLMLAGAARSGPGARRIALARLERALARDAGDAFAPADVPGATPRLWQRAWADEQRFELSAGLEGRATWTDAAGEDRTRLADASGVHVRATAQADRWLAHTHLWVGQLRDVTAFSDALIAHSDVAVNTDDSWLAYMGRGWDLQLGRSRWHWGPGDEASLLLSKTAAPLSGLALHARFAALRADAWVLNATTDPGRGEQLAAHRLEWQPADGVRLGLAEAARYRSDGWQGLYLAGVIPYSIVQRLLDQDGRDSAEALRNNVAMSADASVRVADGARVYGELLIDDLHARTAAFPNRLGWQLGWDGTGDVRGTRLTWNLEWTRLSRWVYTSYYGRDFTAQGRPLGFPTGADAERLRARVAWDPNADWQCALVAARTVQGEDRGPFVPGDPVPPVLTHAGVAETARGVEGTLRWWPAAGADVALTAGREWRANVAHTAGASAAAWRGALALRLYR